MMHAAVARRVPSDSDPYALQNATPIQHRTTSPRRGILVSWSCVELQGPDLTDCDYDIAVSLVVEAFKAAKAHDKDELLISNIAPDAPVGSPEVTEFQIGVEELVTEAVARLGRELPEMRLSLGAAKYDLRCYLGRNKPTDHLFDQEH